MAVIRAKISLNNADIPLVASKAQRPVLVPSTDQAPRTPRSYTGTDDSTDYNLAAVIYAENVVPVTEGLRSVSYQDKFIPTVHYVRSESYGPDEELPEMSKKITQMFPLYRADTSVVWFSPAGGECFYYRDPGPSQTWYSYPLERLYPNFVSFNKDPAECTVTTAYVDGMMFVCFSGLTVTTNDGSGDVVNDASLYHLSAYYLTPSIGVLIDNVDHVGGVVAGEIDGISTANGNLFIYSKMKVMWTDFNGTVFDFDPDVASGGQYSIPADLAGNISAITAVSGGALIFSPKNCVGATYNTANASNLYTFREISGAGGVPSPQAVTQDTALGACYAYTSAGIQRIALSGSEFLSPAVSDFLTGRQFDRFNWATNTLTRMEIPISMFVKVTAIGTRYIIFSYGTYPGIYSYALFYDIVLKRWGKLRIVHRDCVYWSNEQASVDLTYSMLEDVSYEDLGDMTYSGASIAASDFVPARMGLMFLTSNTGNLVMADWSDWSEHATREDRAVVILGRFQLTRASNVQFNRVEVEKQLNGSAAIQLSTTGGAISRTESLILVTRDSAVTVWGGLADCVNFNIVLKGALELSAVILELTTAGKS